MIEPGPSVIALTGVASLVPMFVAYLVVLRLQGAARRAGDRPVPHPRWLFGASVGAGAAGGMLFALVIAPRYDVIVAGLSSSTGEIVKSAVIAPVAEELGKAAFLLVLFVVGRTRSRAEGLVLGLAAGAGFACIENLMFGLNGYALGGVESWFAAVRIRLAYGTLIHTCSTGLFGAVLGAARARERLGWVVAAPLLGALIAVSVHGTWNLLILFTGRGSVASAALAHLLAAAMLAVVAALIVAELRRLRDQKSSR